MIIKAAAEIEEATQYSKDVVFVKGSSSEMGEGFYNQTVYYADGSSKVLKIDDAETAENTIGFYAYDLNKDGFYELDAADEIKCDESYIWDEHEGVMVGAIVDEKADLYNGLLTVTYKGYEIADIKVADAKFVDVHSTTANDQYTKTLSTLAKVMEVVDKGYEATLSMNVSEDGAVVIFLTSLK